VQEAHPAAPWTSPSTSPALLDEQLDRLRRDLEAAEDVVQAVTALRAAVVPAVADWCAVDLLDDSGSMVVEVGDSEVRSVGPLPTTPAGPLSRVLLASGPSTEHQAAVDGPAGLPLVEVRHGERLREGRAATSTVVPLQARGRVVGALTLARTARRAPLHAQDIVRGRLMAHRTALAVQQLRLHEQAHAVSTHLQRSLLPRLPEPDGLSLAARYLPAQHRDQVGGDWFDAFVLPDGVTALTVGDVVGHDVSAAAQMAQVRNLLRGCAWHGPSAPDEVLVRLDEVVLGLQVTSWATAVYSRLEPAVDGHLLRWSNAGHPPPLLVPRSGPARLLHRPVDVPIGVAVTDRHQHSEPVPRGSTVLLYTDGLVERRTEDIGAGLDRLTRVATGLADRPLEALCDALVDALAPPQPEDDLVLLAVRTHAG
jgi:phosphoserine phosphatase RsbU/P